MKRSGDTGIIKLAAVQMRCRPAEAEWNLQRSKELASQAADMGAELICFPESVLDGYACGNKQLPGIAQEIPGPAIAEIAMIAKSRQVWILWTLPERLERGVANTAVLFDPAGETILHYRKVHLCPEVGETDSYLPGTAFPTVPVKDIQVGVMICFDRHFPETTRTICAQGAHLILHPTATVWFDPDPESINTAMMRARAYENRCYILSVNQVNYQGGSALFGPWGDVIKCAGSDEEIFIETVDLSVLDDPPEWILELHNTRKPHLYSKN
jgi:predicted amidohydrolase